jgi:hypothetical protein
MSTTTVMPAALREELRALVRELGGPQGGHAAAAAQLGVTKSEVIRALAECGVRREALGRVRGGLEARRSGVGS